MGVVVKSEFEVEDKLYMSETEAELSGDEFDEGFASGLRWVLS